MPKTFRFLKWSGKKALILFVLTAVLVAATVGTTLAYIIIQTNSITNKFTPPDLSISISGSNITNDGNTPVYVRAAIVINWVDKDGNILSTAPSVGTDCTLTLDEENWFKADDGFYYCKSPVESGQNAPALITIATQEVEKTGYTMRIQILSSAIQYTPEQAIESAWPAVKVDASGSLTPAN